MRYDTPRTNRGSYGAGRRGSGAPAQRGSSHGSGRVNLGGSYHGPQGIQQRSGRRGGVGNLRRGNGNGGYPLRARSINFQGGRGRNRANARLLILGALAIVLVVLLVVGVSSCVRGCSASKSEQEALNQVDSRVAAGVSDELSNRFKIALDRNDQLAQIAAKADSYDDTALLELALDQPEAVSFVCNYPDLPKTGQAYNDKVSQGTVPTLYDWDTRWGAVAYGEHALALTGSGPTVFSMAYMGLTGEVKTPADMAELATQAGAAAGDSGTGASFFSTAAEGLGLTVAEHESAADNITQVLDAGTYLLLEAKAGSLTEDAHWVLLVTENSDNTVVVHDPTSPEVTARSWSPSDLASACDKFYSVTVKKDTMSTATEE